MTTYRLGKLPAKRPHGLSDLAVYAAGKMPAPPASVAVPQASYPLDGNDQYGDCVMAGVGHLIAAWDAEVGQSDPVPSQDAVVQEYFTLTGGPDSGLNEADVLAHWQQVGLFSRRIEGYAPVDYRNIVELHQAVAFYGGSMLGIACPQSAQQQFAAGEPWTFVPGSPIAGGHCIVALGYTPTALLCATWGGIAEVTYPFVSAYLDEAWAVIPSQFVEAGRGPALDLASLKADLERLQ